VVHADGSERTRVIRRLKAMMFGIMIVVACQPSNLKRDTVPPVGGALTGVFGVNANTDEWLDTQVHYDPENDTIYDGLIPCEHTACQ
jgi:hypothetical protein